MNMELLRAKETIFKLISQFHHATKLDDGELYIYNYCESALESAFNVLGIEEDYIKLLYFCQMWEDVNRAIWAIKLPDKFYNGFTANEYYDFFKEDYESRMSWVDEEEQDCETCVYYDTDENDQPCCSCVASENWEKM